MRTIRSIALLVLVAVVGLTVAPVASAAFGNVIADDGSDAEVETNTTASNTTETTVSTFMQASAADAETSVETGLFEAEYEQADDATRAAIVADRTDDLETTLESLEAERDELRERKGTLPEAQYQARMTRLAVEIPALERSAERTKPRANETGVDERRLDTLQERASELAGPDVTAFAPGHADDDRHPGGGPPDDRGPDGTPPGQQSTNGASEERPPGNDRDSGPSTGAGENAGKAGDAPGKSESEAAGESNSRAETDQSSPGKNAGSSDSNGNADSSGNGGGGSNGNAGSSDNGGGGSNGNAGSSGNGNAGSSAVGAR
ncbi:hypothetical protein [Halopiger djelfimassiliensis]|uniref:hypothetical protein n=1 Tax=Halopiger djelfimassiliensis TaxID=1293047 RepID=UPI000677C9E6|nr:hypothetical protein [Halopiger djelfimassiliensis]